MVMNVKIKKLHPSAVIPKYAKAGDAGMDLTAVTKSYDRDGNIVYGTGLAFEIPEGYVGLVFPRSSLSRLDIALSNCVGVIDSGYRGEVTVKFKPAMLFNREQRPIILNNRIYEVGERVAQIIIIPYPQITFVEADELSETERGTGGYGSSGK